MLGLPHTIHVHPNNLGKPGNYETTIKTMDCVRDLAEGKPVIHMTHIQFESYGGRDWMSVSSGAEKIANYLNANSHVTLDLGQITFTDTTTMTGDGPFQYQLHMLTGNKWVNADVEVECGAGIVPMTYKRSNYAHAVMWAIGLEVCLFAKDPWRVYMTTDHPNGGPFTTYPVVIGWLISKKSRDRIIKRIPRMARRRTNIQSLDREYTLYEIAIITRAATAKSLGLNEKGHLGIGAHADVAVYPIKPKETDPSNGYKAIIKAFRRASHVIKDGQILVKDGEIVDTSVGRTYWVKPKMKEDVFESIASELRDVFKDYYTIEMDNYFIKEDYLARPASIHAG